MVCEEAVGAGIAQVNMIVFVFLFITKNLFKLNLFFFFRMACLKAKHLHYVITFQ
jgi:hypothetical protein